MPLNHMRKLRRLTACPTCNGEVAVRVSNPDAEEVIFTCGAAFGASISAPISPDDYCRARADLAARLWNAECAGAGNDPA